MCFDADALVAWLRELRAEGITLPVLVGIPGEVERRRLLEISMRIGVGSSLSFLRKQRGWRQLISRSSPADRLVDALAGVIGDPELGVVGFHYFTFNQLRETWNWDREKRERCELAVGS
jgi:methylenetetrahydrofolate reductase (NADPH)